MAPHAKHRFCLFPICLKVWQGSDKIQTLPVCFVRCFHVSLLWSFVGPAKLADFPELSKFINPSYGRLDYGHQVDLSHKHPQKKTRNGISPLEVITRQSPQFLTWPTKFPGKILWYSTYKLKFDFALQSRSLRYHSCLLRCTPKGSSCQDLRGVQSPIDNACALMLGLRASGFLNQLLR